jgi:hypothetical protein
VAVSAFGGLTLGYAAASQEVATNNGTGGGTVSSKPSAHQLAVGLAGGLSVDRLLSERLTLRLSARLLSAAYARGSGKVDEPAPAQDTSGFGAALAFDPSIELRLAF